jgi:hypothetical protein
VGSGAQNSASNGTLARQATCPPLNLMNWVAIRRLVKKTKENVVDKLILYSSASANDV